MEPKYQTRAKHAEEQIYSELLQEKGILKPWSLATRKFKVRIRTLQTTADEASIIFANPNHIRPGYEADSISVTVPCLFIKVSGEDDAFSMFYNLNCLKSREYCFTYSSIASFLSYTVSFEDFKGLLLDNGQLDREKLLNSGKYNFLLLRREYQKLYLDAIEDILINRKEYFTGIAADISPEEILCSLLQLDENILQAYNAYDFQFQPPSIVIHNEEKEKFLPTQAACLHFLHLLGFDVIIITKSGVADLENVLNSEMYCVFYGEKRTGAGKRPVIAKNTGRKVATFTTVVLLAVTVLILSKYLIKPNTSGTSSGSIAETSSTASEPVDASAILSDTEAVSKMLDIKEGQTINLSDIHPSMKGSVTKTRYNPSFQEDSYINNDTIMLGNIVAERKLEYGRESMVSFEYVYNVKSCEKGVILIGFNEINFNTYTDKVIWAVSKGYGLLTITIPVTPRKWVETPFTVDAGIIDLASYKPLPVGYRVNLLPSEYPDRVTVN